MVMDSLPAVRENKQTAVMYFTQRILLEKPMQHHSNCDLEVFLGGVSKFSVWKRKIERCLRLLRGRLADSSSLSSQLKSCLGRTLVKLWFLLLARRWQKNSSRHTLVSMSHELQLRGTALTVVHRERGVWESLSLSSEQKKKRKKKGND